MIAVLAPLAILYLPGLSLGTFLFMISMLVIPELPLPELLTRYSQSWLDGPFLEITFFLPLSLLGGLGAAGLMKKLERWKWAACLVAGILFALIAWNMPQVNTFKVDKGCNYVRPEDLEVIHWIDDNLPENAVVVISGFSMGKTHMGTDAGLWVTPITGRKIIIKSSSTNWDELDILREICEAGDVYIFAGNSPNSFQKERFLRTDWYEIAHVNEKTQVIHAVGCIGVK